MARRIEFGKFLIIECTAKELREVTGQPIVMCDFCADVALAHNYKGFYIAVLNQWICKKCYEDWKKRAHWYEEDSAIENKNFEFYAKLFGLIAWVK